MASTHSPTDLAGVIAGYRLCAKSEGKSPKTVQTVADAAGQLERFLLSCGLTTDAAAIGPNELRAFIIHLQGKRRFADHPLAGTQEGTLSPHTVNTYLRSLRALWSWLVAEGMVERSPFERVRVPRAPRKVVATFSDSDIAALLDAIDTGRPEGFRDYVVILTLLDTGLRVSELAGLRLDESQIHEGVLKVMGKGSRERLIPVGGEVRRLLRRYVTCYRPEPAGYRGGTLFLTGDGRPLTARGVQRQLSRHGKRAGLSAVRCSPHTLRHTAAVRFLRNGGNVFALQRLLGHSSLAMTRHYCELADADVWVAHGTASPVDNLSLAGLRSQRRKADSYKGRGRPRTGRSCRHRGH